MNGTSVSEFTIGSSIIIPIEYTITTGEITSTYTTTANGISEVDLNIFKEILEKDKYIDKYLVNIKMKEDKVGKKRKIEFKNKIAFIELL